MLDNETNNRDAKQAPIQTGTPDTSEGAQEKRRKRKKILLVLLLLLLLLALGTCTAVNLLGDKQEDAPAAVAVMPGLDANAEDISDREGMESAMQSAADANYFTLQVNPDASFSSQTGEGRFELVNPLDNVFPISFDITLDESGQKVYQSGAVMPGKQIRGIALDSTPDPGSYRATVNVSIYDRETQEKEGETKVKITLHVE
ncbi:hypothetical protein C1878_12605 [Gordonibacter sp. 28C]|uniref:hypothetical protein n=1 Tax=Gordonibacter sp. 28C TaxID=2078569 RepID=UPI000DF7E406|nr:hypothetical protein [Gordonibacter sp. 28C]RDB60883.1 hypothetical protein C1878_12605 [Gordonibacter sp. 28C]